MATYLKKERVSNASSPTLGARTEARTGADSHGAAWRGRRVPGCCPGWMCAQRDLQRFLADPGDRG